MNLPYEPFLREPNVERKNTYTETDVEYVHMTLMNGEAVRFKREWAGYRFTDDEVQYLVAGYEIKIKTETTDGIIGALDWQEYLGHEYFGFAPWDARVYVRENAPVPNRWNGHVFTEKEKEILRSGKKLLLVCSSANNLSTYGLNVSFGLIPENTIHQARWGILPHFGEFEQPASSFTRETCVFHPVFGGKALSQGEIEKVRRGASIPFSGISKKGKAYQCRLTLELDGSANRWKLVPHFQNNW